MKIKIGTHSGPFHADDVMAVAILKSAFRDEDIEVVRSRDPRVLSTCTYVVDVGGEYSPDEGKYDHHQIGGAGERPNGVRYSSAGLVWKHHGAKVVRSELVDSIDLRLIQPIDALDNGQGTRDLGLGDQANRDAVRHFTISDMLSSMNPTWQYESEETFDSEFRNAVATAQDVLSNVCRGSVAKRLATTYARQAIDGAIMDERVIVYDRFLPTMDTFVNEAPKAWYFVFLQGNDWLVQCVPPIPGSNDKRAPMPAEWAGLRGEALAELTGVSDAVFCHNGRFICGAKSREGALALARLAVSVNTPNEAGDVAQAHA